MARWLSIDVDVDIGTSAARHYVTRSPEDMGFGASITRPHITLSFTPRAAYAVIRIRKILTTSFLGLRRAYAARLPSQSFGP